MEFEETLKELAEKFSDKFEYRPERRVSNGELCEMEMFIIIGTQHKIYRTDVSEAWHELCQDFIELVLDAIGIEYMTVPDGVIEVHESKEKSNWWHTEYHRYGDVDWIVHFSEKEPNTKLEASKDLLNHVIAMMSGGGTDAAETDADHGI